MASLDTDENNRKGEINRLKLLKGSGAVKGLNRKMSKRVAFQQATEDQEAKPFYKLQRQTQMDLIPDNPSKGPPLAR